MDTFVVRVYRSVHDTGPDDNCLRGVVEQISTGSRIRFHGTSELLSILHRPRHEKPGGSTRGAEIPRAGVTPDSGPSSSGVHRDAQPSPTKGEVNEPGRRQTR